MKKIRVGMIGCGNISTAYCRGAANSNLIELVACADLNHEAAVEKANEFGLEALDVDGLLARDDIEIVINITVPLAHAVVSHRILDAGKHVYSEKPLADQVADARPMLAAAASKGLRIGCAPDTFLGGAHQACRHAIDAGIIGKITGGSAAVLNHGMEDWHPNPAFFFQRGGGPLLDLGPYYITQLVNLIGPIRAVSAIASKAYTKRTVGSGARAGESFDVNVPTTVNGALLFENGANVAISASWDCWQHQRAPLEIYGSEGSMLVPDPNFFGGSPQTSKQGGAFTGLPIDGMPFGTPNREDGDGTPVADYRIIGLIDMAAAIAQGRPHRANGGLALHVLEVLEALESAAKTGQQVTIESSCARPEPLPAGRDETVFLQ